MEELDYRTCIQCHEPAVICKDFRATATCPNGHKWFRCEHGLRCEGHVRNPCLCPKYQQKKAKRDTLAQKVYIHRKKDRNPSKKQTL